MKKSLTSKDFEEIIFPYQFQLLNSYVILQTYFAEQIQDRMA